MCARVCPCRCPYPHFRLATGVGVVGVLLLCLYLRNFAVLQNTPIVLSNRFNEQKSTA